MKRGFVAVLTLALLGALTGVGVAQTPNSQIFVVHGVPGLPVDVYVDGELTLSDFQPGDIAGPLELPPGTYKIDVTAVGDSPDNAVLTTEQNVLGGLNASAVAHLDGEGNPTVSVFLNNINDPGEGNGRLVVRHTAAAPAVDVLLEDGTEVFTGLTNPNEESTELAAGTYSALVAPAGAGVEGALLGPLDVPVTAGTNTIVYAVGSPANDSLGVIVQTVAAVPVTGDAPAGVPSGSGDLADGGISALTIALLAAAVLAVGGGASLVVARRR